MAKRKVQQRPRPIQLELEGILDRKVPQQPRTVPLPETVCPRMKGDSCKYPNCDCPVSYLPADRELEQDG